MSAFLTSASEASIARHRARVNRGRALRIERARRPENALGLDPGDLVRHATWGDGRIVHLVGNNALVVFPRHGEKLLRASFLAKIG
jgi:hypothetical protein